MKDGFMSQQWVVHCGGKGCFELDQVAGSKRGASEAFKLGGWINDRHRGWLCPDCGGGTPKVDPVLHVMRERIAAHFSKSNETSPSVDAKEKANEPHL